MFSSQLDLLHYRDIRPNIGLWWYLLLEMFERYSSLYRNILALFPWLFVVPVYFILGEYRRLCEYPYINELYCSILVNICVVLHPHPTLMEHSLAILLLFQHAKLILRVPSSFFTIIGYIAGVVLTVFMWFMWAERAGSNANFFYFQTILLNLMALGFIFALLRQIKEEIEQVILI